MLASYLGCTEWPDLKEERLHLIASSTGHAEVDWLVCQVGPTQSMLMLFPANSKDFTLLTCDMRPASVPPQYAAQFEESRLQALPPDVQRLAREVDPLSGRLPECMPAEVAMLPAAQPLQLALSQFQVRLVETSAVASVLLCEQIAGVNEQAAQPRTDLRLRLEGGRGR